MTDELFSVPVVLSPKLAWIKRHQVKTELTATGWRAYIGRRETESAVHYDAIGRADTEDDAILVMAKSAGMRLWNEENL